MKNITLSADERLIDRAREIARTRRTTLNEEFRKWLDDYAGDSDFSERFHALMRQLRHVDAGRKFTRNEMNERH